MDIDNENSRKTMPLGSAFCKIISALSRLEKAEKVGNGLALSRRNLAKAVILTKNTDLDLTLEEKEAWQEFVRQMSLSFYKNLMKLKDS